MKDMKKMFDYNKKKKERKRIKKNTLKKYFRHLSMHLT